jgi:hypothetical protein
MAIVWILCRIQVNTINLNIYYLTLNISDILLFRL